MHFSRFFPRHELRDLPPTPVSTLNLASEIARETGLAHVYIGNLHADSDMENTRCHKCDALLIERNGYRILRNSLQDGRCPGCRAAISGTWK
jgi:pyruvate formate lyase activating enzyme